MDSYQHARACLEHLDLRPGATLEDVAQAYRTLVQVWHPDRFAKGTAIQCKAEERFKDVTAAYAWLNDNPTFIEELAVGRTGETRYAGRAGRESDGPEGGPAESRAKEPWFRRRYRSPMYAVRRWIPRVRLPWVFLGALAVGSFILLRDRDPYGTGILRPQVFQNVADAIEDPTPENLWVYDQRIDVRRLPGVDSPVAGFFRRGDRIRVTERVEGWRRVVDPESGVPLGWVQESQVGAQPPRPAAREVDATPRETAAGIGPATEGAAPTPAGLEVDGKGTSGVRPGSTLREDVSRPFKTWENYGPLVTEPFDVPLGSWQLVFTTRGPGSATVQLYAVDANRIAYRATREEAGASTLSFEGGGTYRVTVTTPGVAWEASIQAPR